MGGDWRAPRRPLLLLLTLSAEQRERIEVVTKRLEAFEE